MSKVGLWLRIIRPQTLFASVVPTLLGLWTVCLEHAHVVAFSPVITSAVTVLCALGLQVLSNLINDYYDYRRGTDKAGRIGFRRALAEGEVTERQMLSACIITLVLVLVMGLYLIWIGGLVILLIGVSAILFAWLYTATTHSLSYLGIADIFVLLYYGMVPASGTYYMLTRGFSATAFYLGAVSGLISMCVLMINNLRDAEGDAAVGKKTIVVRWGKRSGQSILLSYVLLMPFFAWMALGWSPAVAVIIPGIILYFKVLNSQGVQYNKSLLSAGLTNVVFLLLCLVSWPFTGYSRTVTLRSSHGEYLVTPLSENTARIRYNDKSVKAEVVRSLPELVYLSGEHHNTLADAVTSGSPDAQASNIAIPRNSYGFPLTKRVRTRVKKDSDGITVRLPALSVRYDNSIDNLVFFSANGDTLLVGVSSSCKSSTVQDEPCVDVSQSFATHEGEHLYGTGQFQDGYLDIKDLSRRLTQVNTQISVPMIVSSRGYALLWNNYGLTELNPSDSVIVLSPWYDTGTTETVNATGTHGNRREVRRYSAFAGTLTIPEGGRCSLLLDMGQSMSRRQFLVIDEDTVIDCSNTWLPPTTSVIVDLEAGVHSVMVQGTMGDSPRLFWRMADGTTTFRSPVAHTLDFTVFSGSADECIASYRTLTGRVPQMPAWMFGYIHCRERYNSSEEILENAAMFRERRIPLDVIVQDWQWWGKYGWNALQFDEDHYPDPKALTDSLHRDNVHLMLSVWSKVDHGSAVGRRLEDMNCYIEGTDWIDFFDAAAADYYCRNFLDSLGRFGIDAWWFDATEPENDDLAGRRVGADDIPGEFFRNVYPLMVNSTMYNGLKGLTRHDEPVILTRSAFSGIQRYGVVTWSGDVGNSFDALRRQITGGLDLMCTGLPWWTFDAGGFFRPGNQYTDETYQERMLRWIQVATFLPFMRVHGYMSRTEPWRYSSETERIFRDCILTRKELAPYLEKCARMVSTQHYTMMRPLVFDFASDSKALEQETEYMLGPDLLVCPILEAGVTEWTVYLPENSAGWKDYWSDDVYGGGEYYTLPVTLDHIPVFVKLK